MPDQEFPDRNLDHLHARVASGAPDTLSTKLAAVLVGIEEQGGQLVIGSQDGTWNVAVTFGKEAPDSDMAGGASYGVDPSLNKALTQVLTETGWDRPTPYRGQEDDGDQD